MATLVFLEKLTLRPEEIEPADADAARSAGVSRPKLLCRTPNEAFEHRFGEGFQFSLGRGSEQFVLVELLGDRARCPIRTIVFHRDQHELRRSARLQAMGHVRPTPLGALSL